MWKSLLTLAVVAVLLKTSVGHRHRKKYNNKLLVVLSHGSNSNYEDSSKSPTTESSGSDEDMSSESSGTSCDGDPNAMIGCDKKCKKRCPGMKPKRCKCKKNSCMCKDGYMYNSKMNKCVKPDKCDSSESPTSKSSDSDEDTSSDNSGTSCDGDANAMAGCDKMCKKRCPGMNPKHCRCPKNSCMCKEGYLFNPKTNKCVKPDKCDAPRSTTKSPYSDEDMSSEETSTMSTSTSCDGDKNAMTGCDKMCKKRCPGMKPKHCRCPKNSCMCKEGYLFNPKTNKCVKPDKCDASWSTTKNPYSDEDMSSEEGAGTSCDEDS